MTLTTDLETLYRILARTLAPAAARREGKVRLDGDETGLQRFVDIFGWRRAGAGA